MSLDIFNHKILHFLNKNRSHKTAGSEFYKYIYPLQHLSLFACIYKN